MKISEHQGELWKKSNFLAFLILKTPKRIDEILLKYWGLSGAKACKSSRSRQELSNEYLLVKIGVNTAENEPLEVYLIIKPWDLIFTVRRPAPADYRWQSCPLARLSSHHLLLPSRSESSAETFFKKKKLWSANASLGNLFEKVHVASMG